MTKMTRDIPSTEGMTVADRLKAARQDAELTRKALADATGIPASTLEKYERGDMDPNTTRLQTLCDHLGVSVNWVLNGADDLEASENAKPVRETQPSAKVMETMKTAETQPSAKILETSTETFSQGKPGGTETASPANETDPMDHIRGMLADLDDMRAHEFEGVQRGAMALIEDIHAALKYLEPSELLKMAFERNLHESDCETADSIIHLFRDDTDKAQTLCGNIEERIIDTAILGVDLHTLDSKGLIDIAKELSEEHGFDTPKFFSWGKHEDFVPLVRPPLRELAIKANGYDFEDEEEFPKREKTAEKKAKSSLEDLLGL